MARSNARPDLVYYPNRIQLRPREIFDQRHQSTINLRDPKCLNGESTGRLHEIQRTSSFHSSADLSLSDVSEEHEEVLGKSASNTLQSATAQHSRRGYKTKPSSTAVSEISTVPDDEADHELLLTRGFRSTNKKTEGPSKAAKPTRRLVKRRKTIMEKPVAHGKAEKPAAQSSLGAIRKDNFFVRLWSHLSR